MMHTANHIRDTFLQYFKTNDHERVASAPLIPHNDPTLMFVNAGMVPFKNVFTGQENRDYTRATSSQKCVRAGGKHNDLDNVGYTARHHTFFEMLGNFSFGDYFKEQAIFHAWELLTKEFSLPKEKLYITVYHTDDEAFDLWKKLTGFSDDRIIRIPTQDNFWSMGEVGPCGPCSEIFYDHGDHIPGGLPGTPEEDGDRFIEIWNLVFMQYETLASGERANLPKPSIDTGMGLERIAAVLQGVHDNYDIDLFKTLINASQDISENNGHIVSHRVIADHLRSSCFLLADGVMPSNEGRGYVLRRIMRRAMRHAHQLGCKEPLMHKLVPALVGEMGNAFPELHRGEAFITEILKLEEERFKETLGRGLKLLEEERTSLSAGQELPGEVAFKLYDTYGFPLDLTKDILRADAINVDEAGFDASMAEQKARARAAWSGSGDAADETIWFDLNNDHGATEFLGYDAAKAESEIVAIIRDNEIADTAEEGEHIIILLNQTPFYGESGGQMGDHGTLYSAGVEIDITDTSKKLGSLHTHHGVVRKGHCTAGDIVTAEIATQRRDKLRNNHSATHLLHAALRNVLGDHVTQKGSLVAEDRLRFDISHPKAITAEEIRQVEDIVNQLIRNNSHVRTRLMPPEDAIEAGAMALFGEKYGDEVRVVSMGLGDEMEYSVELCGGTHVRATGDIGLFKIISESAIASGVRRIEALTGADAFNYLSNRDAALQSLAQQLKVGVDDIGERVTAVMNDRKQLEKSLAELQRQSVLSSALDQKEIINDITVVAIAAQGIPAKELRSIGETVMKQLGEGIVALASNVDGKAALLMHVSKVLSDKISAVDLVRTASEAVGGKGGGGKPNMAQAGGPNGHDVSAAIDAVKAYIDQNN